MKKCTFGGLILVAFFSVVFIACKSNDSTPERQIQLLTDSSAFKNNSSSDTATVKNELNKEKEVATESKVNPVTTKKKKNGSVVSETPSSNNSSSNNTSTETSNSQTSSNKPSASENSSTADKGTTEKKGWSKGAQGAVIGGAAGAVGGAIISKKKGVGTAVGAAVGAAGGYIIGREKDKKDGRVKKNN